MSRTNLKNKIGIILTILYFFIMLLVFYLAINVGA